MWYQQSIGVGIIITALIYAITLVTDIYIMVNVCVMGRDGSVG